MRRWRWQHRCPSSPSRRATAQTPAGALVAPSTTQRFTPAPQRRSAEPAWNAAPDDGVVEEPDADHIHQLGLDARTRFYNLEKAITTYGVGTQYRVWPWTTVGFGVAADAQFGSTGRVGGEVDVRVISLGAVAAWRFMRASPASLTAELRGGGSIVTLEGVATAPGFADQTVTGATGHVSFALAPSLWSGHAELALPLEIGGLFRAPRGRVTEENEVQLDGFWFGAGLAFKLGFVDREPAPSSLGTNR